MNDIKAGLYAHALTKEAITDLVGAGANARIYPQDVPEDAALPYLVISLISNRHGQLINISEGLVEASVQIDCWADDSVEADELYYAVRISYDGYIGLMGSVMVQACLFDNDGDIEDMFEGLAVSKRYGRRMEFDIWYEESQPQP
jgi:hypothetical protein